MILSILPLFYGGTPIDYYNLNSKKESYLSHLPVKVRCLFDGKSKQFYTHGGTIKEAIHEAGINFGPFDITEPSSETKIFSSLTFRIIRAQPVTIVDSNQLINTYSASKSPYEIVRHSGIKISKKDFVEFASPIRELVLGPKIYIKRAPLIYLLDGTKTIKTQSWASKVEEVLKETGIILGKEDKINFNLDERAFGGMKIQIIRLGERITKELVKIPYFTIYLNDPTLPVGKLKIIKNGRFGQKIQTFKVRYENSQIKKKRLLGEKIISKPSPEVVERGTKPIYFGWATWYGSYFQGRRTASGEIYNMYALTAAHKWLPFGSWLRVTNLSNGRSVIVRINDRGPYSYQIIDLSYAAKKAILMDSVDWVSIEVLR